MACLAGGTIVITEAKQKALMYGSVGNGSSTRTGFYPRAHRMVAEQRCFDNFRAGERFPLPSRIRKEAILLDVQAVSGDNHPIHSDRA